MTTPYERGRQAALNGCAPWPPGKHGDEAFHEYLTGYEQGLKAAEGRADD